MLLIESTQDTKVTVSSYFHDMDVLPSTGRKKIDYPYVLTQFNYYSALYELRAYTNNPNEVIKDGIQNKNKNIGFIPESGHKPNSPMAHEGVEINNKFKKGHSDNSSSNMEDSIIGLMIPGQGRMIF